MKVRQGFTLVELLAVIVIIGILIGLLIPAMEGARERARTATCASNLRQLHQAVMNYVVAAGALPNALASESANTTWTGTTWNETPGWIGWAIYTPNLATAGGGGGAKTYYYSWYGADGTACITNGSLYSYTGPSPGIYVCPTHLLVTNAPAGGGTIVRSYSMNTNASGIGLTTTNSTTLMVFADAQLGGAENTFPNNPSASGCMTTNQVATYHSGGTGNAIFLDGHIERRTSFATGYY